MFHLWLYCFYLLKTNIEVLQIKKTIFFSGIYFSNGVNYLFTVLRMFFV